MITLNVNGKTHEVDADPATPLLYVLRNDLKLNGAKFGCGLGQCGACTVMVDGGLGRLRACSSVRRRARLTWWSRWMTTCHRICTRR